MRQKTSKNYLISYINSIIIILCNATKGVNMLEQIKNTLKNLINKLEPSLPKRIDRYMTGARDIAEVEQRLKQLERNNYKTW